MPEQFYTILTKVGKAKIANATALGTKVNFCKFQIGDSNGNYYNPTEDQMELKHKVWEGSINNIKIDNKNPNWIIIEVILPGEVGGFTIREAAIIDEEENIVAIAKYPETYKPQIQDGSSKDILIRTILEVSNANSVTLKVDPTIILATKKDVEILEQDIKNIKNPVTSVNNKIGDIKLKAIDIKTEDNKTIEEKITQVNSSLDEIAKKVDNIDLAANKVKLSKIPGMNATNVQAGIQELFQNVDNGKKPIASAITDRGVSTSYKDTFKDISNNIKKIKVGDYEVIIEKLSQSYFEFELSYNDFDFKNKVGFITSKHFNSESKSYFFDENFNLTSSTNGINGRVFAITNNGDFLVATKEGENDYLKRIDKAGNIIWSQEARIPIDKTGLYTSGISYVSYDGNEKATVKPSHETRDNGWAINIDTLSTYCPRFPKITSFPTKLYEKGYYYSVGFRFKQINVEKSDGKKFTYDIPFDVSEFIGRSYIIDSKLYLIFQETYRNKPIILKLDLDLNLEFKLEKIDCYVDSFTTKFFTIKSEDKNNSIIDLYALNGNLVKQQNISNIAQYNYNYRTFFSNNKNKTLVALRDEYNKTFTYATIINQASEVI